jgi:hypothetical protein
MHLDLGHTAGMDLAPLLACPNLQVLYLNGAPADVSALAQHPTLQYIERLRGILVAISLGCVVLAYYGNFVAPQRAAIRALRAGGVIALYASQVDSGGWQIPHAKPWNPVPGLLGDDWFNRVVYVSRRLNTWLRFIASFGVSSRGALLAKFIRR